MMAEADEDQSGEIEFTEFLEIMNSKTLRSILFFFNQILAYVWSIIKGFPSSGGVFRPFLQKINQLCPPRGTLLGKLISHQNTASQSRL